MAWLDAIFTTPALQRLFSDASRLAHMLAFETALARAQGRLGIIPPAAADLIAAAAATVAPPDPAETARAGTPVIPVVAALRRAAGEAGRHVHLGATSQDVLDTALVLQLREAADLIDADLARVEAATAALAAAHRATPIAGRTWLMHAAPTTFGFKCAGWLDAVRRDRERLRAWRPRGLVVQLGGATGNLADPALVAALAEELHLAAPAIAWHTARDRVVELATTLGLATGSLGKIARDVALLSQSEIAEVAEPRSPGRGASSAMPQKQNPIGSAITLAAAARVPQLVATLLGAMPQEHERGIGNWMAEWETLPALVCLAGGAAAHMAAVLEGLHVDPARMRANLDATGGQIHAAAVAAALTRAGAADAHATVEKACRDADAQGRPLRELLEGLLPAAELDRLFDPTIAAEQTAALVDLTLARGAR